jgi:hypothetical protein
LPKRYHRPPTVKRRKARRPGQPTPFEEESPPEVAGPEAAASDEFDEEDWEETGSADEEDLAPANVSGRRESPDGVRHIQRDYSYVRSELQLIAVVAGVLIVALAIVSILR